MRGDLRAHKTHQPPFTSGTPLVGVVKMIQFRPFALALPQNPSRELSKAAGLGITGICSDVGETTPLAYRHHR